MKFTKRRDLIMKKYSSPVLEALRFESVESMATTVSGGENFWDGTTPEDQ